MTLQAATLPNGLRIVTQHMPGFASAAIGVWVDVGARFENAKNNGISHFMEHMAFKGTDRRSALDIAVEFDAIGGALNAYTSMEHTVYYARVLKDDLPFAIDMLGDILQHSTFPEDEVARERDVILQEIAMHHDTPDDLVFDHYTMAAYPGQPIGHSVLGTAKTVSSFQRNDLLAFLTQYYGAKRMVLTVTGAVDHDALVKLAETHFGGIPAGSASQKIAGNYVGGAHIMDRALEQLHLMMGFPGVSYHDEGYHTQQVLATILGGGMSSRLFQEVREKRGLAYTISAFTSSYADTGMFSIYSGTAEEDAETLVDVIIDELRRFSLTLTETELERAKNQYRAGTLMAQESVSSVCERNGRHMMCYGRVIPIEEALGRINAVTVRDVGVMLETLMSSGKFTYTALGPTKHLPKYEAVKLKLG
jgi:predicted Zn-dependent peptidase